MSPKRRAYLPVQTKGHTEGLLGEDSPMTQSLFAYYKDFFPLILKANGAVVILPQANVPVSWHIT